MQDFQDEDEDEKLVDRLKDAIRQYEEENEELTLLLKEILYKYKTFRFKQ